MQQLRPTQPGLLYNPIGCLATLFVLAGMLGGCDRDEIHAYRVPKAGPSTVQRATPASTDDAEIEWTIPESWQEIQTTVQMRVATFLAQDGLEVTVASFPGDVGGLVANVNRWRGQIGLPETDEQGMAASIEHLDEADVIVVDLLGESMRLVGTVITVGDGKTWFVKAVGQPETIDAIKVDLVEFSKTFRLHEHSHEAEPEREEADSAQATQANQSFQATWAPPIEWKIDPDASPILTAAFLADSGARITLTSLKDQGGGSLGNINRWRDQLGLTPVASLEQVQLQDLGGGAMIVDIVSEDGTSRIVAGIVPEGPQTLFFKMTGTPELVETELERFDAFVYGVGKIERGTP